VFVGPDDGLDPVAEAEFCQDPTEVDLHGAPGEERPRGDLEVGGDPGEVEEYLGRHPTGDE
jgi:hypothetical protein